MQFVSPLFLWALLALLIPIIIHLFHFRRRKKVYFTNVELLKEIKQQKSTRNRLRSLLILLSRCLALSCLVFAFAQPIITHNKNIDSSKKSISVFVDNSYSMNADHSGVQLINLGKSKAEQIVGAYSENDEFQILSNNITGKQLGFVDRSTALQRIEEITSSPVTKQLEAIRDIQKRNLDNRPNTKISYMISDFRSSISSFENPVDSTIEINLVPIVPLVQENVSINSCKFESEVPVLNENNKLIIELTNHSPNPVDGVQLSLTYNSQKNPLGTVKIPGNSTITDTAIITPRSTGWHRATVSIDDYPITFDDHFYLTFFITPKIKVLSIYEQSKNTFLSAALDAIDQFEHSSVAKDRVRYDAFDQYDLIIIENLNTVSSGLSSKLREFAQAGKNVLIFPGIKVDVANYNQLLSSLNCDFFEDKIERQNKVGYLNQNAFVFKNVFRKFDKNIKLPVTEVNYTVQPNTKSAKELILDYRTGSPFLSKYSISSGSTFLCFAPLDLKFNNLTSNAEIFIPLIYKMAISTGNRGIIANEIGKDKLITLTNSKIDNDQKLTMSGQQTEFIPGIVRLKNKSLIDVSDQIKNAGIYRLMIGDSLLLNAAFNYSKLESDLNLANIDQLAGEVGENVQVISNTAQADLSDIISTRNQGIQLWRYFLILSLLFLLLETILLRIWKP